jgi:hypothetical protein
MLWVTDGTETGTEMLKEIKTSLNGAVPRGLTLRSGEHYFAVNNSTSGEVFWMTDDNGKSTIMVNNINYDLERIALLVLR